MGNTWDFPSISHSMGKCNRTHCMERSWEIGNHTFPIVQLLFSHLILILWYTSSYGKCMRFPINFPQYGKMQQNPLYGENLGNWELLFPQYGYFFPIRFPSHDILHHMGNVWVFPSISHSTGKCNKTHCMRRTWEVGTHNFPIVWVLFSRSIPILRYTSLHGKCMGFPINFP